MGKATAFLTGLPAKLRSVIGGAFAAVKKIFQPAAIPPMVYEEGGIKITRLSPPNIFFMKCGHFDSAKTAVEFYGRTLSSDLDVNIVSYNGNCAVCSMERIKRLCIHCARCGALIAPGDVIALRPPEGQPKVPDARVYGDAMICCAAMECCENTGWIAGQWTEDGFHPFFEGRTIAEEEPRVGKRFVVLRGVGGRVANIMAFPAEAEINLAEECGEAGEGPDTAPDEPEPDGSGKKMPN